MAAQLDLSHSTEFSGGVRHRSSKASRGEDVQIEQPVSCWDCSSFHFHATLASVLGATLVGYQVIQQCKAVQKMLLASTWMMEPLHRKQFPLDGVVSLV
jgi:hypothetical protein